MKIESERLENIVWNILLKIIEVYHEKETATQSKQAQILSAISKIRQEKRFIEIKVEHCRSNRLELYHQWKEGGITKEEYIIEKNKSSAKEVEYEKKLAQLNQRLSDTVSIQEHLEQKNKLAAFTGVQCLTKELADELIELIEVYHNDKIEIKWKMKDIME